MISKLPNLRTWIEINTKALHSNVERFLRLIPEDTRLMAVVKSNAYGHGLVHIAKALLALRPTRRGLSTGGSFSEGGCFGVDSITEGLRLRRENIKSSILILGYTIPDLFREAFRKELVVSIADFNSLNEFGRLRDKPKFFIKIDSGMHRRGFLPEQIKQLLSFVQNKNLKPMGVFSHFASASDTAHKLHSKKQIKVFQNISDQFKMAGFDNLIRSMSATGGTIFYPDAHLDMVRIGMGIYGYPPSPPPRRNLESELTPVLSWKTFVSEIKEIPAGSSVGYNFLHKVKSKSQIAILPVGYWHGYDRRLSNKGEVLVCGRRASVIGLISMDMVIVDVTGIDKIKVGDEVVLIGRQGQESIWADELARKIDCSHYELLTRINPLIKRVEV
ncbi:MAG: alanine racemase [bacterium]|nr:alanine racemase [bacterium]